MSLPRTGKDSRNYARDRAFLFLVANAGVAELAHLITQHEKKDSPTWKRAALKRALRRALFPISGILSSGLTGTKSRPADGFDGPCFESASASGALPPLNRS